jgi:SAM-dependent methyltransferase
MEMDIIKHNREAWNRRAALGNTWTIPVDRQTVEHAKTGNWDVFLTPTKPVPREWFGDLKNKRVLCLASGGGQQGPILAAAGARVTVFDNSPAQLEHDRMVAERDKLRIVTELGDMRDLTRFANGSFDLIFHPVSNCFVDDIESVWFECYRVLAPGGSLLAGFCNPLLYLFDPHQWEENGRLEVRFKIPYSDLEQLSAEELQHKILHQEPLEFGHSLEQQIAGQISAGFVITGFYEDSFGGELIDPYIDTFIATRAFKPNKVGSSLLITP